MKKKVVLGRRSQNNLYDRKLVSFDKNCNYYQKDIQDFININALSLKQQ